MAPALQVEDVEKHLGSRVRDPYGRVLGTLVSFYSEVDGTVSGIEVSREDGGLIYIPAERASSTTEGIVVIPEWRVEAVKVEQQLDRARKRARAVEDLFSSKEIGSQSYEEMKKSIEGILSRLRERAKGVRSILRKRLGELEDEILHIDKASNHLKLGYTSGEVGEQRFKAGIEVLRASRARAVDEKRDVEKHLELLEKLESEAVLPQKIAPSLQAAPEPQAEVTAPAQAPQQGEAPIQVRIVS